MSLRDKYAYAISTAKGKFDGSAQERDGKLHFVGSVKSEEEKNEIWSAGIRQVLFGGVIDRFRKCITGVHLQSIQRPCVELKRQRIISRPA